MSHKLSLKTGTATGTFLSMMPNILSEDIIRTVVLAVLGAVVSFAATYLLKWFSNSKEK